MDGFVPDPDLSASADLPDERPDLSWYARVVAVTAVCVVSALVFANGWIALVATGLVLAGAFLRARRARIAPSLALLALCATLAWTPALGIFRLSPVLVAESFPLPFSASLWKRDRYRQHMLGSLLGSGGLIGLERSAVRGMLGVPDEVDPGGDEIWRVGRDRGIGIDSEWLRLEYDERGRVARTTTFED